MAVNAEAIVAFIRTYQADNGGKSPTYQEIADGLGIKSRQLVTYHLGKLESAGLIERGYNKTRSIVLAVN